MVKVVFLGTGDAFNSDGRFFTSVLIDGSFRIMLDCSPHAVYALRRLGYSLNTISHILVTHTHGDHAGGIPFFLLNLLYRDRGTVTIVGQEGLRDFIVGTFGLLYKGEDPEDVFQTRHPSEGLPFRLGYMSGAHPVPSYIYNLEIDGRTIVYTGDTAKVDLSKFAKNADLIIHEASTLNPEAGKYGHSTPMEAAWTAKSAEAKLLAIVHSPRMPTEVVKEVRSIFPETLFPEDLEEIVV